MTKLFQAFLTGIFFTFILDFFIFLGIFLNYIKFHEIDLYYNILFWDNQNIYLYITFSIIIGLIIVYMDNTKFSLAIVGLLFLLSFSTIIPSIGYSLGKALFMEKRAVIEWKKYTYFGEVYYRGRDSVIFYDNKLEKIILFNKKEIKQ